MDDKTRNLNTHADKEFWNNQAKKYKGDTMAVNFDVMMEELELYYLKKIIGTPANVLDVGCGNGNTILYLAEKKPLTKFYGIDSSKDMIVIAKNQQRERKLDNVSFRQVDAVKNYMEFNDMFNVVIAKRLLINIPSDDRMDVIKNIHSWCEPLHGRYIMTECFYEPLERINKMRVEDVDLSEIMVHDFNEYLNIDFLRDINRWFTVESEIDFGSFYYFISRIFNAYLSKGEIDYSSDLNELAVKLSKKYSLLKGYSPEVMYVLCKAVPSDECVSCV